ncbi:PTS sugar transporter subunit IIC [Schnuerera sp. xch1]|uniref:PTS sugar transporter subunit IIC n=1 Tax=Schnuerera sp. xch1 TaxID=2874283 RepID=UPI001CC09029|nr:PTS sugar transporter subunit IIC [Schnuerera sp. xch1]MBZ2174900.1 PTS sugar transporter subunit IIC [Schnuerera sp. xch1]
MNKLFECIEKGLMPPMIKISEQRHLKAIRDGLIASMPLMIIGSIFLIIAFPPIPALAEVMAPFIENLTLPVHATFEIMGLIAVFAIAYNLGKSYNLDGLTSGILSLSSFILVTPRIEEGFQVVYMGSQGLFVAIIIAIVTVEIYRLIVNKNLIIKMPEGVPEAVGRAFGALIPGLVVVLVFWVIRLSLNSFFKLSIFDVVERVLQTPLKQLGGSFLGGLIAVLLIQVLWSAGIHGISVVASVMAPIWYALAEENAAAKAAGEVLPNVMGQQMMAIWIAVGGSGMVLALAILFVWKAKSKHVKSLGKMTIWSSFFNISEPIMFGAPVVMNPILIIPFILAPVAVYVITYLAMALNIVGRSYAVVPWTTPAPFSGILTTGDWKAGVLMIVGILISMAIYYPFFRVWDNQIAEQEVEQKSS